MRPVLRLQFCLLLFLSALSLARAPRCAGSSSEGTLAQELQEARAAYEEARFEDALARFLEVRKKPSAPRLALELAIANSYAALGDRVRELHHRRAAARFSAFAPAFVDAQLRAESRLGLLREDRAATGRRDSLVPGLSPFALLALSSLLLTLWASGLLEGRGGAPGRRFSRLTLSLGLVCAAIALPSQFAREGKLGTVHAGGVELRATPHLDQAPHARLQEGAAVRVRHDSDRWAELWTSKGLAFVPREAILILDDSED